MSYADFPAVQVYEACLAFFDARRARIEREREEFIAEQMRPNATLLERIFRRPKTREAAEAAWSSRGSDILSPEEQAEWTGEHAAKLVLRLKAMTGHMIATARRDAPVHLSPGDFAVIASFMPVKIATWEVKA